jgi:hypothetical protein
METLQLPDAIRGVEIVGGEYRNPGSTVYPVRLRDWFTPITVIGSEACIYP